MQKITTLLIAISYTTTDCVREKGQQWQQTSGPLAVIHQSTTFTINAVFSYITTVSACEKGQQLQQDLGHLAASIKLTVSGKGQQWQQALDLFAVMQKKRVPSMIFPAQSRTALVRKGQQWQQTSGLLTVMHQSFVPTFSACDKGQQWHQAL